MVARQPLGPTRWPNPAHERSGSLMQQERPPQVGGPLRALPHSHGWFKTHACPSRVLRLTLLSVLHDCRRVACSGGQGFVVCEVMQEALVRFGVCCREAWMSCVAAWWKVWQARANARQRARRMCQVELASRCCAALGDLAPAPGAPRSTLVRPSSVVWQSPNRNQGSGWPEVLSAPCRV